MHRNDSQANHLYRFVDMGKKLFLILLLTLPAVSQNLIHRPARANHPFTVVGETGAILGSQDGTFEIWQNPVKILSNFHVTAHLQNYDTPLDLNKFAATIDVYPSETIICLSHAAITVREHILIDRTSKLKHSPAIVYFEIHSIRPADLVFSFVPVMQRQWPAPSFGTPGPDWRKTGYILNTDNPAFYGIVAMPGSTPGPSAPYQERVKTQPTELHLHIDPKTDDKRLYPLFTAVGDASIKPDDLLAATLAQEEHLPEVKQANVQYYKDFLARTLSVTTPDSAFNDSFRWAEISMDQSRIQGPEGMGLAAGWSTSDDSARPGYGWFFGRDTLWSLYAVNSYGDFTLTKKAIDFLLLHQRADGKMMHEYSQSALTVDWKSLPYLYASADATPLLIMQMQDYVNASGDVAYLKSHWDNVQRAWQFIRSHSDNGLYANTEGTGWVEEWPSPMPHQEVYLAALDVQAGHAMSELATLMQNEQLATEAKTAATTGEQKLAAYRQADGFYAFSRNADSTFDRTKSIFPSVAWWSNPKGLAGSDSMFDSWASSAFSVDWGIRSVPSDSAIYDPISYHHGSMWPLYTGWVALAEFRAGRSLQAIERTRQTLALYDLQDLGATTEVLSGEFLQPLSRSSTHQLWSSAMAIAPVVRGLLGLQPDALRHALQVEPHLPAEWNKLSAEHVQVGPDAFDLTMTRDHEVLQIEAASKTPTVLCLSQAQPANECKAPAALVHRLSIPLPPIEVSFPTKLPFEGDRSTALHVLHQAEGPNDLSLSLEAPAGSTQTLLVLKNRASAKLRVEGGELNGDTLTVRFPAGSGYSLQETELRW
ncbi:amylo-alpha-1,6-glucosidase [Granulicella sibirica]|uniref:Glycogen debranching enzyme n=1 Tax=Granulicella sibirica TaxID=2479048 RepID=A0A4Q0SXJ7_9BACT|nr:glycogen debranching protein [Granulicella sibirica]RXH54348.1 Glycogen debranching enzyme [Granulicella sibirica]